MQNLSIYQSLNANSLMCWNLLRSLPSLKKIDRLCKDNYRPVNILTALSKVFEGCHSNQLLFYFEELFSNSFLGLEKGTAVKVHCWEWSKTGKVLLIMETLLEQKQLITASHLTVCPTDYSWPNSLPMASHYLLVNFCVVTSIIAINGWK